MEGTLGCGHSGTGAVETGADEFVARARARFLIRTDFQNKHLYEKSLLISELTHHLRLRWSLGTDHLKLFVTQPHFIAYNFYLFWRTMERARSVNSVREEVACKIVFVLYAEFYVEGWMKKARNKPGFWQLACKWALTRGNLIEFSIAPIPQRLPETFFTQKMTSYWRSEVLVVNLHLS